MENTVKIKQLLMNAIFEVFEKMFFVFLEPVEEDVNYDMIASINFAGSAKGSIDILLTSDLADAMVQNMLSLDEEGVTATKHQKIFVAKPTNIDYKEFENNLKELRKTMNDLSDDEIRSYVKRIVKTYRFEE